MVKTGLRKKKRGKTRPAVEKGQDAAFQDEASVEPGSSGPNIRFHAHSDQAHRLPDVENIGGSGDKEELPGEKRSERRSAIKRLRRWLLIGLVAAVLLSVIFIVSSKITFIFNDELNLRISPLQQSFSVENRDAVVTNITLVNSNFIQCKSQCAFTLTSLADGRVIYESNETLKHNEQLTKQFTMKMPGKGSGQRLYMFESECINLRSVVCLTDQSSHYKSSMIIINYGLTAEEKRAKELMQQSLDGFRKLLSEVASLQKENIALGKNLPPGAIESQLLRFSLETDQQSLDRISAREQALIALWDDEDYIGLMDSFSGEELSGLLSLKDELSKKQKALGALIELRNRNIESVRKAGNYSSVVNEMMMRYQNESNPQNDLLLARLNSITDTIFRNYIFISSDAAHSEDSINMTLQSGLQNLSLMINDLGRKKTEEAFLLIYGNNLLRQKGTDLSLPAGSGCDGLRGLAANITKLNENSSLIRVSDYNWSIGNGSFDQALKVAYVSIASGALNRSREEVLLQVSDDSYNSSYNRTTVLAMIDVEEARLNADLAGAAANAGLIDIGLMNLMPLVMINDSSTNKYIIGNCAAANHSSSASTTASTAGITGFLSIPFESVVGLMRSSEAPVINVSLPGLGQNPALCCVFSQCSPCCSESDCSGSISPVIFIHGHAFNDANTPEYSMNSFTKIQRKLMSDGFISFGELDLKANQENSSSGEWGESRAPAAVRASYYYITYYTLGDYSVSAQKTESIENYAIRLKDIIDLVEYKTGSSKVSIVAHSMGGLVAREYVALFGYDDISKLILVNTPNHGISGKVKDFCSVLGAKKECGEMAEGSIFLSRLNARQIPANAQIYAIRSTGCEMDGKEDGDGIVTADSAYLEGAHNYEIKGNCSGSLNTGLHSDVLDPALYPETYDRILSILKS